MAYDPQSIADILARGSAQQVPLMSQPKGFSGAVPGLEAIAQGGFQGAEEARKKKSILDAQQTYSDYLAKVDSGTANQQDHVMGRMAAMSLGITPPDNVNPEIWRATQAAAGLETPAPGNKQNVQAVETLARLREQQKRQAGSPAQAQALTTEEMNSLQAAASRSNNPLPLSMVSFRGPRAKIMAQALLKDPNWSPVAGETALALGKTNAGSAIQLPARKIAAILPRIDAALQASNRFPRSSYQVLNRIGIKAAASGTPGVDPQTQRLAQDLLNKTKLVADEFQSTIGAGSDSKLDLAMNLLDSAQTVEQFQDAARNMKEAMVARRQAILTGTVPPGLSDNETGTKVSHDSLLDKYGTP